MAILDLTPSDAWRWLALALVASCGAVVGWLAGPSARRIPVIRRRIALDAAEGVDPSQRDVLARSIGRALVRWAPEFDLVLTGNVEGEGCDLRAGLHSRDAGLVLVRPDGAMPLVLQGPLESPAAGAEAAAYLLAHWPDAPAARAIIDLTGRSERIEMRLLAIAARYRLSPEVGGSGRDDEARRLIESWPAQAPESERHRLAAMLAASLISQTAGPSSAVQAYLALHLTAEALQAHWAAGRLDEAVDARHLIARIRLALARAEGEPRHLEDARAEIVHVLAYRPRAGQPRPRRADLVLAALIEQEAACYEPGTAALARAAAFTRRALSIPSTREHDPAAWTPADAEPRPQTNSLEHQSEPVHEARVSGEPDITAALADSLTELGKRLASPQRLREAVAVARTAVRGGAPPLALARPLLTLGLLLEDVTAIEEAAATGRSDPTPCGRRLEAKSLSMLGTLRSDTTALAQSLALWRDLERSPASGHEDLRWHARTALAAARYAIDRAAADAAVGRAEALVACDAPSPIEHALDQALLAEALGVRCAHRPDGTADAQRAVSLLDAALASIAAGCLPCLRAHLDEQRRSLEEHRSASIAFPPAIPGFERTLIAIADGLRDEPEISPAALARSRQAILVLIDAAASRADEARLEITLQWLARIERIMMQRL